MKCIECGKERTLNDFLKKDVCYKCQYKKKTMGRNRSRCRQCKKFLFENRWIYCSAECAKAGEKAQKKTYWTNLL